MIRRGPLSLLLLALAAAPASARPGPSDASAHHPDDAVSLPLGSLRGAAGLGVQYEHLTPARHWSGAVSAAIASTAGADYDSLTLATGVEARYWIRGSAVWTSLRGRNMIGWFVGGRLDLAFVRTTDSIEDRHVGSTIALEPTLQGGYRFAPWRGLEITPSFGAGLRTELDPAGRLPTWTRPSLTGRLTIGWMF